MHTTVADARKATGPADRGTLHKVCYVLKRFPRLSETFILNEVRALERLGIELTIVSLLPREEGLHHSTVSEVRAPVHYMPADARGLIRAAIGPHVTIFVAFPIQYLATLGRALWLAIRYRHPSATFKNFIRAVVVAAKCRQEHVRHVHAHFANTPTRVAYFVSTLCGIPFSFTAHAKDLYLSTPDAIQDRVAGAKFVVTCTQYNVEYLKQLVPVEDWKKIHLVYHGADLAEFPGPPGAAPFSGQRTDGSPIILSVGRLVPKKGMKCLIEACATLRNRGVPFRCRIVGSGPLRNQLQSQIEHLGLADRVVLLGSMTHDTLIGVYGEATVFALVPQIAEDGDRDGIPNVLIEAMAAGLPVVSSTISGIPELIKDGVTGVLVKPNDATAIADAIADLLRNRPAREYVAAAGRRHVMAHFECWHSTRQIQSLLLEGSSV